MTHVHVRLALPLAALVAAIARETVRYPNDREAPKITPCAGFDVLAGEALATAAKTNPNEVVAHLVLLGRQLARDAGDRRRPRTRAALAKNARALLEASSGLDEELLLRLIDREDESTKSGLVLAFAAYVAGELVRGDDDADRVLRVDIVGRHLARDLVGAGVAPAEAFAMLRDLAERAAPAGAYPAPVTTDELLPVRFDQLVAAVVDDARAGVTADEILRMGGNDVAGSLALAHALREAPDALALELLDLAAARPEGAEATLEALIRGRAQVAAYGTGRPPEDLALVALALANAAPRSNPRDRLVLAATQATVLGGCAGSDHPRWDFVRTNLRAIVRDLSETAHAAGPGLTNGAAMALQTAEWIAARALAAGAERTRAASPATLTRAVA